MRAFSVNTAAVVLVCASNLGACTTPAPPITGPETCYDSPAQPCTAPFTSWDPGHCSCEAPFTQWNSAVPASCNSGELWPVSFLRGLCNGAGLVAVCDDETRTFNAYICLWMSGGGELDTSTVDAGSDVDGGDAEAGRSDDDGGSG
jgi:hypothetical protein